MISSSVRGLTSSGVLIPMPDGRLMVVSCTRFIIPTIKAIHAEGWFDLLWCELFKGCTACLTLMHVLYV